MRPHDADDNTGRKRKRENDRTTRKRRKYSGWNEFNVTIRRGRSTWPTNSSLIFRFLAEVNVLSSDDGPLHWLAVFPSLVPITVLLSKVRLFEY